jgi:transposase-like protein
VRRAIQHSQESLRALAQRHGVNQKTVAKWKKRTAVDDLRTGPKDARSTVLSIEEEAIIVAFRRHTLLPLDDCLYALQATIPHLTCSSLHRCLARHGISRLPQVTGDKEPKRKFKTYPIGYFHIDIADQTPLDQRPGRADEPHHQGSHRQTISLRQPPAARDPPPRLHRRLQLRPTTQNPQGPHAVRIHLQNLDNRTRTIHNRPDPSNAGTKHLVRALES